MDGQMITNLISSLAVVVSIVALFVTLRSTRASERLSEREIELVRFQLTKARREIEDEKRASVSARLYKVDKSNWRLKVYNQGPAEAKNVRIVLNEQNQLIDARSASEKFPMTRLEVGQSVEMNAYVHLASPSKEWIVLNWDDASGIDRENRLEITL